MDQLIISLHNFLAELGSSSSSAVEESHLTQANLLKTEVVGLYSHWDSCNTRAMAATAQAEEAVAKLRLIERDVLELRRKLRARQVQLVQKNPRKLIYKSFVRMTGSGSAIVAYFESKKLCNDVKFVG